MPQFITLRFITSGTVTEVGTGRPEPDLPIGTMEGYQMNATVNLVLAISAWAAIGFPVQLATANQTQTNSTQEAAFLETNCAVIKCQGDFPVLSTRKYAEEKRRGIDRELHRTNVKILGADGTQG